MFGLNFTNMVFMINDSHDQGEIGAGEKTGEIGSAKKKGVFRGVLATAAPAPCMIFCIFCFFCTLLLVFFTFK